MTAATVDMQAMSEDELLAAFRSDEHAAAAQAEAARRDQADKAARQREQVREEWRMAAHEQMLAAEAICCGNLLSREGLANGPDDPFSLWYGREDTARKYASWELNDFWDKYPRVTITSYTEQRAAAMRAAREDTASTEEAASEGLAGDERGSVRHGSETATAEPVRGGQSGQPDRPVQRGGRVTVVSEAATAARVAANTARHMEAGREAAERRLVAARGGAEISGTIVRREATAPAQTAAGDIPGDQLLDLLRKWIGTYVRLPSPAALDVMTAWVAHSHMKDENGTLVFRATPRLYFLSSEPGSGKSKCLELLNMLCPDTFGLDLEPTKAGLVHTLSKEHATVLLDEGDLLFSSSQRATGTRAVLNGGYARHGTTVNGKGNKATRVNVFGAVALAGLDVMEKSTGNSLDALLSRGLKIRMKKAGKNDRPAKVDRVAEGQAEKMKAWLEAWASQVLDDIKDYQPEMPEELDGRAEEISTPLVAVADAAGGEWPERIRAAVVELALDQATAPAEDDESPAEAFASFASDLTGSLAGAVPDETEDDDDYYREA